MLKYFKFYHLVLITILVSESVQASEDGSVIEEAQKVSIIEQAGDVSLLEDRPLDACARDVRYMKTKLVDSDKFTQVQRHGIITLSTLGVNGYGSSIIVWDGVFEPDSYINHENLVFREGHPVATDNIAHGTVVAACAVSRYPPSHGFAYGATIYQCPDPSRPLGRFNPGKDLQEIESIISHCVTKGLTRPRVINMSMNITHGTEEELKYVADWLTDILQHYDMLLVMSGGNDEDVMSANAKGSLPGQYSLRSQLLQYPELLKHMILVGAAGSIEESNIDNQPALYSNKAGDLQEHVIFAEGLRLEQSILLDNKLLSKQVDKKEGTSFAAPIVTSVVDILFKYFNHLSAQEIKQIILGSAAKLRGFKPEIYGHGGIDPLNAWIMAVEYPVACGPYASGSFIDFEYMKFLQTRIDVLTMLDLSGVTGLRASGSDIVSAIRGMDKLVSINLLDTDLSNAQTVEIVTSLSEKHTLSIVKITMPDWGSNVLEYATIISSKASRLREDTPVDLFIKCACQLLFFPIASTVLGVVDDLRGDQGPGYAQACRSLARIPKLEVLTLGWTQIIKYREWTKQGILEYRKARGLNQAEINFAN